MKPSVSSLYQAVELEQEIRPLLIGERCNSNGSKRFRELLLADDYQGCLKMALDQEAKGAQVLDLCVAYAGRDEKKDLLHLVKLFAGAVKIPLMIDSTTPECIEESLKIYPGRCIINSINLEDGGKNLQRVCKAVKRYGAAVVALTINEKGMAMTADEKVETARMIYDLAVKKYGLRPQDLLFDTLTFTIGSGDETLRDAAIQTIEAIKRIKSELPGVFTVLGLSNISFGLRPAARRILNSMFLHEAVEAGLDAAIVDSARILPLAQIGQEDREICLDLLYDRVKNAEKSPLMTFIDHFEEQGDATKDTDQDPQDLKPEQDLHQKVLRGDKDGLEDALLILMARYRPLEIVNRLLVPAMRTVGELFGRGEILLPFVLQSAEVMKKSVGFLEPYMDKQEQNDSVKILLATVQGDVHDIGKNLVDIILTNNGFKVFNLGIKVTAETIIEKAREYDVDVIGLSGLLVKSAIVMQDSLPQYKLANLTQPILLGGAALTRKFVAESCVPNYDSPVIYCPDAFAGLKAVQEFEAGTLQSTVYESSKQPVAMKPGVKDAEVSRENPVPEVPFYGVKYVTDIDLNDVYPYINQQALFRGRWGYRRKNMDAAEYQKLITETVEPMYEDLKQRCRTETIIQPKVAYGYFKCYSQDNAVHIQHNDQSYIFEFPRQEIAPNLCIADYFKTKAEGGDIVGFFVVTIGDQMAKETHRLLDDDAYHDYMVTHGFGVEVTDALAEYFHEVMRREMAIAAEKPDAISGYVTQEYQGSRYGFGYPACPDLEAHIDLFKILQPEKIGVTLTENMEMVPEQTTSAIIAHHPQAKYFAV